MEHYVSYICCGCDKKKNLKEGKVYCVSLVMTTVQHGMGVMRQESPVWRGSHEAGVGSSW